MIRTIFSENKNIGIINEGGPNRKQQIQAIVKGDYWFVLNAHFLRIASADDKLRVRVNAFKHSLQSFGPKSEKLPDLRQNTGAAHGHVFHGHVNDSRGKTYVLEWAIIDEDRKKMAIIGFDSHENYHFRQKPLSEKEKQKIIRHPENVYQARIIEKNLKSTKEKYAVKHCPPTLRP